MLDTFPLTVLPDWGLSSDPEADVTVVKLGDGYTHRRPAGINHIKESWSPHWGFLTSAQATSTYAWLKSRLKLTPFLWTNPIDGVTYRVICESVQMNPAGFNDMTLSAKFEQDFGLA